MAGNRAEVEIKANADTRELSGFKRHLQDLQREVPILGRAFELLKNPIAQVTALLTALAAGARRAIREFASAETQFARLDAALARSGQLTDEYRKHLHDLAGSMQEATGVADDQWLEALRKLTQFGADASNIDQLAKGVENLAGVLDGDLAGASELLGRALQGNFDAFGRYGITLEKTGDKAKDLEELLKKLADLGEGQLAAANETMAGGFRKLSNALGDFFEGIGGVIARTQVVQTVVYGFATSLDWLAKVITPTVPSLDGLKNVTAGAGESLADAKTAAQEFADSLGGISDEAKEIARALDAALKSKRDLFGEHDERDAAQEELGLALIDRDVAAGKLSEGDARVRRAGVKQFYAGRRHARRQDLLQTEIAMLGEQDQAAAGEIGEITARIGEAQVTSRNAAQLEAKRRRAFELKEEMLEAMRDEEKWAWVPFGLDTPTDALGSARTEGKRRRYFAAATELSVIAAGLPRYTPFTTSAKAREEAITAAGVPRIAELTASRTDLAARREALQAQLETGNIRFGLGRQTAVTQLEAAGFQELNQQRAAAGSAALNFAKTGGGGQDLNRAIAGVNRLAGSVERIPAALLEAIEAAAQRAERAERAAEMAARHTNNRRDP